MRPEAQAWWEQANYNLEAARDILTLEHWFASVFFAHQAAECGLKAVWMVSRRSFPQRTTNLIALARELDPPPELDTPIRRLNVQFIASRDPFAANGVPARNYDRVLAEQLVVCAGTIVDWCATEVQAEDVCLLDHQDPAIGEFARALHEEAGAKKVILFGSRARGDWLKESDYDFVIVSPDFEGVHFVRRPVPLYDCWKGWPAVELLCYTPEEFERKSKEIGIVAEAVREGIEL